MAGRSKPRERVAERLGPQRAVAVRKVLRLVAVRECDVGEVDVERHVRLENGVDERERLGERRCLEERTVARRVHVREVEHGPHPVDPTRDLDDVVDRSEVADATHHLDAERHGALLPDEALAERAELLDDCGDRVLAAPPEEEAGMEDDELGTARRRRCPALRSSAPTADVNFRPLASRCPMKPKSGAWTESAMSFSRASSPSRSANG